MIVRLTGTLLDVDGESAIIERGGIAREVLVPGYSVGELAACRGREVMLHTLEYLEGSQSGGNLTPRLVGFLYPEDRDFYKQFVSVKGIGSRKALKALAEPMRKVARWIENGDSKALSTLPGIGPRAADRIVAELKGKLNGLAVVGDSAEPIGESAHLTQPQRDALEVLLSWGDQRSDAQRWLERAAQLHPDLSAPEDWVRCAYRVKTGAEG